MLVKTAEFVMSNSDVCHCPKDNIPEYAFIGRSNVGKSSLINMLTGRKALAKTSGTPGKTQLINHFRINKSWFLVDLPGYGYARTSKKNKKYFQKFIVDYFKKREQLVSAFVLVDIRHNPQKIDTDFMSWLGENSIPFSIVFTKSDKEKLEAANAKVKYYKKLMLETDWEEIPTCFVTSSLKHIGKTELLNYIYKVNKSLYKG